MLKGDVRPERCEYYVSDWTPADLVLRQGAGWTWLLSTSDLNKLLDKRYLVNDIREVTAALHTRLTQPLINILLLLLGLPFFLNREPHNVLLSVGLCLLVAILCFVLAWVSQNVASTTERPEFAVWLPILVFFPVASYLMLNIKT